MAAVLATLDAPAVLEAPATGPPAPARARADMLSGWSVFDSLVFGSVHVCIVPLDRSSPMAPSKPRPASVTRFMSASVSPMARVT